MLNKTIWTLAIWLLSLNQLSMSDLLTSQYLTNHLPFSIHQTVPTIYFPFLNTTWEQREGWGLIQFPNMEVVFRSVSESCPCQGEVQPWWQWSPPSIIDSCVHSGRKQHWSVTTQYFQGNWTGKYKGWRRELFMHWFTFKVTLCVRAWQAEIVWIFHWRCEISFWGTVVSQLLC